MERLPNLFKSHHQCGQPASGVELNIWNVALRLASTQNTWASAKLIHARQSYRKSVKRDDIHDNQHRERSPKSCRAHTRERYVSPIGQCEIWLGGVWELLPTRSLSKSVRERASLWEVFESIEWVREHKNAGLRFDLINVVNAYVHWREL